MRVGLFAVWAAGQLLARVGWGVKQGSCEQAKYTKKLMNDKELTSFRKLTNWSTVK